jgi:non-specific protein-tyrosine kinase
VLIAATVGAVLAVGAILLLDFLDETVKTREEAIRLLQLPVVGVIGRGRKFLQPAHALVTLKEPFSPIAEAYRRLRANLQSPSVQAPIGRLLVSSASPGDGASTTACNLAVTAAQAGKRVVLVDTNLRRPSVHRFFGLPNRAGLTTVLLDHSMRVDEALVDSPVAGLKILTSGPLPPNPTDLLGSERMRGCLTELQQSVDLIVLDSPAVDPVVDGPILGALSDAALLVVKVGRTRRSAVQQWKASMQQSGVELIGVVLNGLAPQQAGYRQYHAHAFAGASMRPRWRGLFNF